MPSKQEEAESIIERIMPRLNHVNPSVVLSTIKVIVRYMDYFDSKEAVKSLSEKISSTISKEKDAGCFL